MVLVYTWSGNYWWRSRHRAIGHLFATGDRNPTQGTD